MRSDRIALALLVFAALVRILFLLEAPGLDLTRVKNDGYFFDDQARRLAGGNWLLRRAPNEGIPEVAADGVQILGAERYEREFGVESYTHYPGYEYFVAASYWVAGPGTRLHLFVQEGLDVLACALVYLIGRRLYDRTVARVALALAGSTGPLVLHAGVTLRESLLASLVVLFVYLVLRATDARRTLASWGLAGVAFGAAWIVKGSVAPIVPFLLPSFFTGGVSSRTITARAGVFALGAVSVATPFMARNASLGLPPLRMATNEFVGLLYFNVPGAATRGNGQSPECIAHARHAAAACEGSSLASGLVAVIAEHGGFASLLRLQAERVKNDLVADDAWDNVRESYLRPCVRSLALAPVRWKLIAPFVLLGVVLALTQRPLERAIVLGPPFLVIFTSAMSLCLTRYRILGDHMHALLAASAFVWLYREARHKHVRAIVAAVAALLVCQALKDPDPPPTPFQIARYMVSNFGPVAAAPLLENAGILIR